MKIQNKQSYRIYIFDAVVILVLIMSALVFALFTQEPKSDPVSKKLIHKTIAKLLSKDPNHLTDADFAQITRLHLDEMEVGELLIGKPFVV